MSPILTPRQHGLSIGFLLGACIVIWLEANKPKVDPSVYDALILSFHAHGWLTYLFYALAFVFGYLARKDRSKMTPDAILYKKYIEAKKLHHEHTQAEPGDFEYRETWVLRMQILLWLVNDLEWKVKGAGGEHLIV